MAIGKVKKDHRKALVEKIIKRMEDSLEYKTPWINNIKRPINPVTGTVYRGINSISLISEDYADPRFYTFNNIKQVAKQMKADGVEVFLKKGSVGTPIFKAVNIKVKGPELTETTVVDGSEKKDRSFMVYAYAGTVFNASQIEGIPPLVTHVDVIESEAKAEFLLEAMQKISNLKYEEKSTNRACYNQDMDKVTVPSRGQFKKSSEFYGTVLHELGHATGHSSRLNRPLKSRRHLEAYAYEELIAELSSYFTAIETGIPYSGADHDNHSAYLKSWLEALNNDNNILFTACSAASKATDFQVRVANEYKLSLAQTFGAEEDLPGFPEIKDITEEYSIEDVMDHHEHYNENELEEFGIDIEPIEEHSMGM